MAWPVSFGSPVGDHLQIAKVNVKAAEFFLDVEKGRAFWMEEVILSRLRTIPN